MTKYAVIIVLFYFSLVMTSAALGTNHAFQLDKLQLDDPPEITGIFTNDSDDDGHLNTVTITFSEQLKTGEEDIGDWILLDIDGTTYLLTGLDDSAVTISGSTVIFTLPDTAGTDATPYYSYTDDGQEGRLQDLSNNLVLDVVTESNGTPVAEAGNDVITAPAPITLDSSGSTDPDGNLFTVSWIQTAGPETVTVPTFIGRAAGSYSFTLEAEDPFGATGEDTVDIIILNLVPTAIAGRDRSVRRDNDPDTEITLDGAASIDANRTNGDTDIIAYTWELISGPSPVTLIHDNPASPQASFDTSVLEPGVYVFQLTATDSLGLLDTDTVEVIVMGTNTVPTADAGIDIQQYVHTLVTLDGHESKDTEGGTLAYTWEQVSGPTVPLSASNAAHPTFIPTQPGTYVFSLTVNDGTLDSPPDLVEVSAMQPGGEFPAAGIQIDDNRVSTASTMVGETLVLNGAVHGVTDEGTITRQWSQVYGVTASIGNPAAETFSFTPVNEGIYIFRLDVFLGTLQGRGAEIIVTVIGDNQPPGANAGIEQTVMVNQPVTLAGSGSDPEDPTGATLSYAWTQVLGPTVLLSNPSVTAPTFTPARTGVFRFQLVTFDGTFESVPSRVVHSGPCTGSGNRTRLQRPSFSMKTQRPSVVTMSP